MRTAAGYDAIKEFGGRKYTGMRVGGTHSWLYREGEWEETKVAPDRWEFSYAANKRRKRDAPEGSGAPVGTEYHWYLVAHQRALKLGANEYATSMEGTKYKLAHRRAASGEWSASERAQLRRLVEILEENAVRLRLELGEQAAPATGKRRGTAGGPRPGMTEASPSLERYLAP